MMLQRIIKPAWGVVAYFLMRFYPTTHRAVRRCHPEWAPRRWANDELRKWGKIFSGEIINVSGWLDEDSEGGCYADYFPNKSNYVVSNYHGERGFSGRESEIFLDLTSPVPNELYKRFDVVFNHTTLEHIFDVDTAVANLCDLSKDVVILVTPFLQQVHYVPGSFLDYWRFTPFALEDMLRHQGLKIVYLNYNENPVYPIYLFTVATRNEEKWKPFFPPLRAITPNRAPGVFWYEGRISDKTETSK
jgi:hypothetical protein